MRWWCYQIRRWKKAWQDIAGGLVTIISTRSTKRLDLTARSMALRLILCHRDTLRSYLATKLMTRQHLLGGCLTLEGFIHNEWKETIEWYVSSLQNNVDGNISLLLQSDMTLYKLKILEVLQLSTLGSWNGVAIACSRHSWFRTRKHYSIVHWKCYGIFVLKQNGMDWHLIHSALSVIAHIICRGRENLCRKGTRSELILCGINIKQFIGNHTTVWLSHFIRLAMFVFFRLKRGVSLLDSLLRHVGKNNLWHNC